MSLSYRTKDNLWAGGIVLGFIAFLAAFVLAIMWLCSLLPEPRVNLDPRLGWTDSAPHRICDGSTLVYGAGGVVENSEQCR